MPYKLISLVFLLFFLIIDNTYSQNEFILPLKKPSVFKKIDSNISSKKTSDLPHEKPVLKSDTQNKIIIQKKKKVVKIIKDKDKELIKARNTFIYPKKKPVTYKISSKEIKKSKILNEKDFARAKETIKFINTRKWNSAIKSSSKVKNKEFRDLITWMYLKTTGNGATFNDYKNFIEQHSDYPRINRIKYLAEQKIYLRNNSPTSIINWFQKNPPLGGLGKIKLAEAYLEQGKTTEVMQLIKEFN